MPSGLFSNLNTAFSFGFTRAVTVTVKQSQPIHLIESLFHSKSSPGVLPCPSNQLLRYSNSQSNRRIMAASSSMVVSGDHVADALVSSCGNAFGFGKPDSVTYSDRSSKICRKGRVSLKTGERENYGVKGCIIFDSQLRYTYSSPLFSKRLSRRCFSSLSYSEGNASELSTDGSLGVEHLSSLAVSTEQRIPNQNILKLLSGACYLPHPAKEKTGGEDAHFICVDEQVIGVADGVGGWADVGVNAGEYARELMNNSVRAIREAAESDIDPLQVLEKAHARTNAMGSSTACIVALKDKDLHAINLGDSGFIVVRDGCIIFESPVQQHGFNFTYQLERGDRADLPSSGQVFKIPVAPGDVIVAGSDGLFDNLYNKEIAALVGDAVKEGLSPNAMAQNIAAVARVRALDQNRQSPFSAAAQQAGFTYYGGKLDDLTVVVSHVSTSADG